MDEELGMAVDTEEGLLRSWADTQGCTAPGRSTEVGRGDSLLVPVLLELLVLPLGGKKKRNAEEDQLNQNMTLVQLLAAHGSAKQHYEETFFNKHHISYGNICKYINIQRQA